MSPLKRPRASDKRNLTDSCLILVLAILSIKFDQIHCDRNLHRRPNEPHLKTILTIGHKPLPATLSRGSNLLLLQITDGAPAGAGQQQQPDFEEPIGNQTVAMGKDAQLACKINNLGNFRTAWLRVEDKGILTIHNNIITRNYRVGLQNGDDGRNFVLTIKNVQPSDKVSLLPLARPPQPHDRPTSAANRAPQPMEPTRAATCARSTRCR